MRLALPRRIDETAWRTRDPAAPLWRLEGETMGTVWRLVLAAPKGLSREALRAAVEARLAALVAQMSHWEPASALCRFNRSPAGTWAALPADFARVIEASLALAAASEGAFSPALGRLVDGWGFGPPGPVAAPPSCAALAALLPLCDWRRLTFEANTGEGGMGRLRQPGGLSLDLSGIAKGYAADALVDLLAGMGAAHGLAEVGGELAGRGFMPDGQPWWVELENPPGTSLPALRVALHGQGVATSGSYVRGGHNLDPATGRSAASGVLACSVIHASAMLADGWASALSVAGVQRGMALAERHRLPVRWVLEDGREALSPALAAMLAG